MLSLSRRRPSPPARWARTIALALVPAAILAARSSGSGDDVQTSAAGGPCTPPETPVINFAAYSTPREVYGKIIPAFTTKWKDEHDGQTVIFQESYGASTSQAANVVAGYEADVVALSLGPDVDEIADAGLITHDWTDQPDGGMVSTSVVVFDVRPNNPRGIRDWDDLAADGVELHLVNLSPVEARSVIVQAGTFGEHRFTAVRYSAPRGAGPPPDHAGSYAPPTPAPEERRQVVDDSGGGRYVQIDLPPGTEITLRLEMTRFVNQPSYAFPWGG